MSSKARYEVAVSDQVKRLLEGLHRSERARCRQLALLLLRLETDPKPDGSRELRPEGNAAPGERLWEFASFRIAYRVDDDQRRIEVGFVERV